MKIIHFAILAVIATQTLASPSLDCNFDGKRSFCKWKRQWYGMRRAGWRTGTKMRNILLEDHTSGHGKFVYFLSRSRPTGFRSRFRSPAVVPSQNSCFTFWLAMGGTKRPFPDGSSVLRIYMVGEEKPVEAATPIWTKGSVTADDRQFHKVVISLDDESLTSNSAPVQFVIETIRGGSKKSFVAIDDITLHSCAKAAVDMPTPADDAHDETSLKIDDVKNKLRHFMLAANRPKAKVISFQDLLSGLPQTAPEQTIDEEEALLPTSDSQASARPLTQKKRRKEQKRRRLQKKRKRARRRRKNRRNKAFRRKNAVSFASAASEELRPAKGIRTRPTEASHSLDTFISQHNTQHTCDFIEYTQKLHRCFRTFFSLLRKRPQSCSIRYLTLESCVQTAATSCVPPRDLDAMRVEEIVIGTLRNNFKTEKVFCEEEGAFVYPKFELKQVPIQCGPKYFIKLSECSGAFSSMFHIQHGDPHLCREYYQANECQRQTTAEECNFDSETMLLYGLNLQYQFAHNPFCIHLPFSSWWPES